MKLLLKLLVLCAIAAAAVYGLTYKSPARRAFDTALAAAQNGDAAAQAQTAAAYLAGEAVRPDVQAGMDWYMKAAAQGYAPAAYELAQLYLSGERTPRDVPAGVSYLKLAAAKEYPAAQYALGRLYQTGTEGLNAHKGQAAFYWLKAAQAGDEDAQAAADVLKADEPEFFAKMQDVFRQEQRARNRDAQAAYELAQLYQSGLLLEKNPSEAARWYSAAAEKELPAAQYALSVLYRDENGPLPADELKSLEWLQKAAEGGWSEAQYEVGQRIFQAAQSPEEFSIARQWFDLAGRQNHAGALYMSGILYMQGLGAQKSVPAAIAAFKQAADLGHADAQYVLGQSYWRGIGVKPNKTAALKWLRLAQQNGNAQAQDLLAEIEK